MIPVDQTIFGAWPRGTVPDGELDPAKTGNCMQAAWASLLELPLHTVPHFAIFGTNEWGQRMMDWLEGRGFSMVTCTQPLPAVLGLMSGKSPRGDWDHTVVSSGDEMIHDPHPDRTGVIEPFEWWYLVPLDPAHPVVHRSAWSAS